jgi:hypothetical protein
MTFEDVMNHINLISVDDACGNTIHDNIYKDDNEWQEEIAADVEAGIELQDSAN